MCRSHPRPGFKITVDWSLARSSTIWLAVTFCINRRKPLPKPQSPTNDFPFLDGASQKWALLHLALFPGLLLRRLSAGNLETSRVYFDLYRETPPLDVDIDTISLLSRTTQGRSEGLRRRTNPCRFGNASAMCQLWQDIHALRTFLELPSQIK